MTKLIRRALMFGVLSEAALLAASFLLYSLKHGREPMEPPFNLAATIIQMPGILVANFAAQQLSIYDAAFYWLVTIGNQFLIWSLAAWAFLGWRSRRHKL